MTQISDDVGRRLDDAAGGSDWATRRPRRSTNPRPGSATWRSGTLTRKLVRYSGVSLVSTAISLTVLASLVASNAMSPGWANVVATAVGTGPSFELNRRWVWSKPGRRSVANEIAPFCALSFTALGVSTLAVSVATGWATDAGLGNSMRALVAVLANLTAFGTMWIVQFFVLDRVLFRSPRTSHPGS